MNNNYTSSKPKMTMEELIEFLDVRFWSSSHDRVANREAKRPIDCLVLQYQNNEDNYIHIIPNKQSPSGFTAFVYAPDCSTAGTTIMEDVKRHMEIVTYGE